MMNADHDPALDRLAGELRQQPPIDPALDDRVMSLVRQHGPVRRTQRTVIAVRDWLVEPRTLHYSPLAGIAAAALVVLAVAAGIRIGLSGGGRAPTSAAAEAQWVRFVFTAPEAAQVSLVGDFNNWDPAATPLHATSAEGVWSVSVPLPAGRHDYAFVVNGQDWRPDPAAPPAARSDFGTPNSVVTVSERL